MSRGERLTKRELSWLLTQEARTAAQTLRRGVVALSQHPNPIEVKEASPLDLTSSLDAIDDAMRMLASLNVKTTQAEARGRIDLASLACQVAPNARLHLAPGSGTEVAGEEGELRRVLQVMLAQAAGSHTTDESRDVWITREGDDVRVSVALGPETIGATEQSWLSRTAVRYGGRFEVGGGQETLYLPAEGVMEQKELEALRKELEEAQQQGEAYARELAAVFTQDPQQSFAQSTIPPPIVSALSSAQAITSAITDQVKDVLAVMQREIDSGVRIDLPASAIQLREIVAVLERFSAIHDQFPEVLDWKALLGDLVKDADARASRKDVTVVLDVPEPFESLAVAPICQCIGRMLIEHAIDASPPGGVVTVRAENRQGSVRLSVEDAGARVPVHARDDLIRRTVDPANFGRPKGIQLVAVWLLTSQLDGLMVLGDGRTGGTEVTINLPPA